MNEQSKPNAVDVTTSDNQYRIIQDYTGRLRALRYGEEWRELSGDNMVLMLAMDLVNVREALKKAIGEIKTYHIDWAKFDNESPDYNKDYKPEYPKIVEELQALLIKKP